MCLSTVALFAVLNVEPELVTDFVQARAELCAANLEDFRKRHPLTARAHKQAQESAALRGAGVCGIVPHASNLPRCGRDLRQGVKGSLWKKIKEKMKGIASNPAMGAGFIFQGVKVKDERKKIDPMNKPSSARQVFLAAQPTCGSWKYDSPRDPGE
jgi:hypothetical protein